MIGGLNVVGTRETISINAGVVGNSQPLVSTREFWYSPDLQVNLAITRKDPREGTQVIRVGDSTRAEPDPSLFKVPAGFVVQGAQPSADSVRTGAPAGTPASDATTTSVMPVSPGLVQGLLIYKVAPLYPQEARHNRIQGQVVLSVVIDKSGAIKDIRAVTSPDKSLTDSAISAVAQWRYRPYLLNAAAVEVQTTVVVNYALQPAPKSIP